MNETDSFVHSNNGVDQNYKLRNLQSNIRIMDDTKTARRCCVCRRKERYFLVIDTLQLILVEPEMRRLGWGVVTFVGYLQVFILSHLPVSFGRDTKSRWSLVSGVYARGSKRSHTGGKCVTCSGLTNSREGQLLC